MSSAADELALLLHRTSLLLSSASCGFQCLGSEADNDLKGGSFRASLGRSWVTSREKPSPKALHHQGAPSSTVTLTYAAFLQRLAQPESADIVSAITNFLVAARDSREYLPERCAHFFAAVGENLRHSPAELPMAQWHLEHFMMTELHDVAISCVADPAGDAALARRCRLLRFLRPADIDPGLAATLAVPGGGEAMAAARAELLGVETARSPGAIAACVVRCCRGLVGLLQAQARLAVAAAAAAAAAAEAAAAAAVEAAAAAERSAQDTPRGAGALQQPQAQAMAPWKLPGADDLLPLLIYTTMTAGASALVSCVRYALEFSNPAELTSRSGYCLSSLQSATGFILSLDASGLCMDATEFARRMREAEALMAVEDALQAGEAQLPKGKRKS